METQLTTEQGRALLQFARATLKHSLSGGNPPVPPVDPDFLENRAVFVTLTEAGTLRGCIGNLVATLPLWKGVCDNAINAALHDHRFTPLTAEDLESVTIEVSVLTPPQPLEYRGGDDLARRLRVGVDGVILKKDGRSATFLPQVWEQLATPELFLDQLCAKAGLPKKSWRAEGVSIETYQVESFSEDQL